MQGEIQESEGDACVGDYDCKPRSVAVVVKNLGTQDVIANVVREQGWTCEIVDEARLEQSASAAWNLIVIATIGEQDDLTVLVEKAASNPATRVLVISDHYEPQRVADVLRSGADDFLIAPFDPIECSARMRSLMTRADVVSDRRKNHLAFDISRRTIRSGPLRITFPKREWALLMTLLEADGDFLSAEELSSMVWCDAGHNAAAISTVSRVRQRLQSRRFPVIRITTQRGGGYAATFRRSTDRLPRQ